MPVRFMKYKYESIFRSRRTLKNKNSLAYLKYYLSKECLQSLQTFKAPICIKCRISIFTFAASIETA